MAEAAIHHKQYALAAFLDIEGAFNNVTVAAITNSLVRLGVNGHLVKWIAVMLCTRNVISDVGSSKLSMYVNRGTPQGGVLSPLLWLLVVNDVLQDFDSRSTKVVAYADDVVIMVSGLFPQTLCEIMERELNVLKRWATSCGLNVNPSKTELILFTRNRVPTNFNTPRIDGESLVLSRSAKYLGVILDDRLTWTQNVEERVRKGRIALYVCKRAVGKSWGSII